MKLYHYAPAQNSCLERGILSVSLLPETLSHYASRAKSENPEDIIRWLDGTCKGRSRSISCMTEPLKFKEKVIFPNDGQLFSFDIDALIKDNLVECIYQKLTPGNGGRSAEAFRKIEADEIDYSPLDFSPYSSAHDIIYAFFRHYMIVMKDGFIPSHYLTKEE